LFTGGVQIRSGTSCGEYCKHCNPYNYNLNYLANWTGAAWTGSNIPATALTTFDPDGDGPLPPMLVAAGPTAPYVYVRTDFLTPTVSVQPEPATAHLGESAAFFVEAANGAATYQWYKSVLTCGYNNRPYCYYSYPALADGPTASGSVISGAATPTLIISGVHRTDATEYFCVIRRDSCNSVSSASVALTIAGTCTADFDGDGDVGTDLDIEAFFACLGGTCCPTCGPADFNNDGDVGTDQDIDSFFRVLGGGSC
jgi:hypothetical protein